MDIKDYLNQVTKNIETLIINPEKDTGITVIGLAGIKFYNGNVLRIMFSKKWIKTRTRNWKTKNYSNHK